ESSSRRRSRPLSGSCSATTPRGRPRCSTRSRPSGTNDGADGGAVRGGEGTVRSYARWLVLAGVVAVVLVVGLGFHRPSRAHYFTARVERGDIHDVVAARGTISAVVTVQVGSQVSGTIARLNADFNPRVRRGDVVALIDPALFEGALLQATADLENARAN